MVGGFEVLEEIGRGAMGAVFKARQVSVDRKRSGAKWTAPEVLAVEDLPGTGKRAELNVAAPRHAPPNLMPVAFGPHHEWIKFFRVPTH